MRLLSYWAQVWVNGLQIPHFLTPGLLPVFCIGCDQKRGQGSSAGRHVALFLALLFLLEIFPLPPPALSHPAAVPTLSLRIPSPPPSTSPSRAPSSSFATPVLTLQARVTPRLWHVRVFHPVKCRSIRENPAPNATRQTRCARRDASRFSFIRCATSFLPSFLPARGGRQRAAEERSEEGRTKGLGGQPYLLVRAGSRLR